IAVKHTDLQWDWGRYLTESAARAAARIPAPDPPRPRPHAGNGGWWCAPRPGGWCGWGAGWKAG
ncbi:hypothetical protein, partial [Mycobacterium helveticum]|uniref:hypothetical protein n=1 Tax=Mycobacterium helveticum TaxID=2592811 RepID=UPI001AF020AC